MYLSSMRLSQAFSSRLSRWITPSPRHTSTIASTGNEHCQTIFSVSGSRQKLLPSVSSPQYTQQIDYQRTTSYCQLRPFTRLNTPTAGSTRSIHTHPAISLQRHRIGTQQCIGAGVGRVTANGHGRKTVCVHPRHASPVSMAQRGFFFKKKSQPAAPVPVYHRPATVVQPVIIKPKKRTFLRNIVVISALSAYIVYHLPDYIINYAIIRGAFIGLEPPKDFLFSPLPVTDQATATESRKFWKSRMRTWFSEHRRFQYAVGAIGDWCNDQITDLSRKRFKQCHNIQYLHEQIKLFLTYYEQIHSSVLLNYYRTNMSPQTDHLIHQLSQNKSSFTSTSYFAMLWKLLLYPTKPLIMKLHPKLIDYYYYYHHSFQTILPRSEHVRHEELQTIQNIIENDDLYMIKKRYARDLMWLNLLRQFIFPLYYQSVLTTSKQRQHQQLIQPTEENQRLYELDKYYCGQLFDSFLVISKYNNPFTHYTPQLIDNIFQVYTTLHTIRHGDHVELSPDYVDYLTKNRFKYPLITRLATTVAVNEGHVVPPFEAYQLYEISDESKDKYPYDTSLTGSFEMASIMYQIDRCIGQILYEVKLLDQGQENGAIITPPSPKGQRTGENTTPTPNRKPSIYNSLPKTQDSPHVTDETYRVTKDMTQGLTPNEDDLLLPAAKKKSSKKISQLKQKRIQTISPNELQSSRIAPAPAPPLTPFGQDKPHKGSSSQKGGDRPKNDKQKKKKKKRKQQEDEYSLGTFDDLDAYDYGQIPRKTRRNQHDDDDSDDDHRSSRSKK